MQAQILLPPSRSLSRASRPVIRIATVAAALRAVPAFGTPKLWPRRLRRLGPGAFSCPGLCLSLGHCFSFRLGLLGLSISFLTLLHSSSFSLSLALSNSSLLGLS